MCTLRLDVGVTPLHLHELLGPMANEGLGDLPAMPTEVLERRVPQSHNDETDICQPSFSLVSLQPLQKRLPVRGCIPSAVCRQEHNNRTLILNEIFDMNIADIHHRCSEPNILSLGLKFVGYLFRHPRRRAIINRQQPSTNN